MLDVVSLSQVYFAIFPMDKNIEQRICLKFCIANGISCAESLKMLQKAYGQSPLSKTRLGMKRVAARPVPKDLNFLQKLNRVKAKNSTNIIEQPPYLLSKSELVKFSLIESVICVFTDSSVKRIFFNVKSVNFH